MEVTDLYDAFHALADLTWRRFHFRRHRADEPEIGPPFHEVLDQLEVDLFYPACARQVLAETGVELDPDAIFGMLRICDREGRRLPGDAGRFLSHGLDLGEPYEEGIENLILSHDRAIRERPTIRLFVVLDDEGSDPALAEQREQLLG